MDRTYLVSAAFWTLAGIWLIVIGFMVAVTALAPFPAYFWVARGLPILGLLCLGYAYLAFRAGLVNSAA